MAELNVRRHSQGEGQPDRYVYQLRVNRAAESVAVETFVSATVTASVVEALSIQAADVVERSLHLGADNIIGLLEELRSTGELLFSTVFPTYQPYMTDLVSRLRELDEPLLISSDESLVPWELLHDGESFLGLRYDLGRQSVVEHSSVNVTPRRKVARALLVGDPVGDLPQAREEMSLLLSWFRQRDIECTVLAQSQANLQGVLLELRSGSYDLLHYSGHVAIDRRTQEAALVLEGGQRLDARTIRSILTRSSPAVIFINGCASAHHVSSICSAFMMAGSQPVVGTLYKVSEPAARQFAELFYSRVLAGMPAGQAMRESRELLSTGSDASWAAFVLYGDPAFKLEPTAVPAKIMAPSATPTLGPFEVWRELCAPPAFAVLERAQQLAAPLGVVTSVHMLVAQLGDETSPIRQLLSRYAIDHVALHGALLGALEADQGEGSQFVRLTASTSATLQAAEGRAVAEGRKMTVEDIALGFALAGGGSAGDALLRLGVDLSVLYSNPPPTVGEEVRAPSVFDSAGNLVTDLLEPPLLDAICSAVDFARSERSAVSSSALLVWCLLRGHVLRDALMEMGPSGEAVRRQMDGQSLHHRLLALADGALHSFLGRSSLHELDASVQLFSARVRRALDRALAGEMANGSRSVGEASVLGELLRDTASSAAELVRSWGIEPERLRSSLLALDSHYQPIQRQSAPPLVEPVGAHVGGIFADNGDLLLSRFDDECKEILSRALSLARDVGSAGISTVEFAIALAELGAMETLLRSRGRTGAEVAARMREIRAIEPNAEKSATVHRLNAGCFTARFTRALERAAIEAKAADEDRIPARRLVDAFLADPGVTGDVLDEILKVPSSVAASEPGIGGASMIETVGRDLTREAAEGRLRPVIGRDREIKRLAVVLSRASKNAPLLVGPAGVGKTAVVAGLAQMIAAGKTPLGLADKRIIEVQLSSLIAGSRYRGDLEERLKKLIEEASDPNVILFVDEIHTLTQEHGGGGSVSPADILKPPLASGAIRCIGATTNDEYARFLEMDAALARRFTLVPVEEPDEEGTLAILQALRPMLEERHEVQVLDEALTVAVRLSNRYVVDRRQPDKSIDLVEEACAARTVAGGSGAITAREVQEALRALIPSLSIGEIAGDEAESLSSLEARLAERVVGQPQAIESVSGAMRAMRLGLRTRRGPLVLLFAGPPGVGKTEMARALAAASFLDDRHVLQIDMSEFAERHTVSRLIGSPAGYVGYGEEGLLTGPLRRERQLVVILDEFDRAHPEVLSTFLPLFDDGRTKDSRGREVDARNSIFVLTTNIAPAATESREIGFATGKRKTRARSDGEALMRALRRSLPQEFLDRIDGVVWFRLLDAASLAEIASRRLREVVDAACASQNVQVEIADGVAARLAEEAARTGGSARALLTRIDSDVGAMLGKLIIDGGAREVRIEYTDDTLKVAPIVGEA